MVHLPLAPSSPVPDLPQLEGSVHRGAVGDFSGVQTPDQTPERPSVITSAPPALPPRSVTLRPPILPPRPRPVSLAPTVRQPLGHRLQVTPSLTLIESVTALLQEVQEIPDTSGDTSPDQEAEYSQSSPISARPLTKQPRKLSSTDPHFLRQVTTVHPIVEEVFQDSDLQPQPQINITMEPDEQFREESLRLGSLRRKLERAVADFTEDDLLTHRINVMERDLDRIRDLRDDYQDGLEVFLDKYDLIDTLDTI